MPGNKLQGALSKSPSMAGMTRVSPGVYRDASGKLVGQSGKMLPPRSTSQGQAAIEAANNAADQIRGQGMQNTGLVGRMGVDYTMNPNMQRMLQDGLGRFGPMQTLPDFRQGGSMPEMMQTLQQGFGQQQQMTPDLQTLPQVFARQQQMTPEQQQARLDFAANIRSPRSMGFHQQRQPGQELQGAGFQLPPEELARRRQMVQQFDAQQMPMPVTPMPRGGYRR